VEEIVGEGPVLRLSGEPEGGVAVLELHHEGVEARGEPLRQAFLQVRQGSLRGLLTLAGSQGEDGQEGKGAQDGAK